MTKKDKYIATSLKRGLKIIHLFDEEHDTLSLAEISKMLGVSRTVPYRLLYTLQDCGYVDQDVVTKRYHLTPKVMELGFSYLNSMRLPQIAEPYLEQVRDELEVSCYLSILDDEEVVYVGVAAIPGYSSVNVYPGVRLPAHATANGKLLMAFQEEKFIHSLFEHNKLQKITESTFIDKEELLEEFEQIKSKGYALSTAEFNESVSSVAVPIFNRDNKILAAINVVTPINVFDKDFLKIEALPKLQEISKKLSVF